MSLPGSKGRPLHPLVGLALWFAGAVAMVVGSGLAGALGLGLRGGLVVASIFLMTPGLMAVWGLRGWSWRQSLALGATTGRILALSVLLGGALWLLSIGIMEVQATIWLPPPEYLESFRALHAALAPDNALDAFVSILAIALAPAFAEETLMRGVLLPSLVSSCTRSGAVVISATLFALMHLDPSDPTQIDWYRFAFVLTIGVAAGALRLLSGSLWPPIVAHAALNTLTFLVAPLVDDPSQTTYTPQPLLGVGALVAGAVLVVPLFRALRRPEATEPVPAPGPLE